MNCSASLFSNFKLSPFSESNLFLFAFYITLQILSVYLREVSTFIHYQHFFDLGFYHILRKLEHNLSLHHQSTPHTNIKLSS